MFAMMRAFWCQLRDALWILVAMLLPRQKRILYMKPSPRVDVPKHSPPPLFRQRASGLDPMQAWQSGWYNQKSMAQALAARHPNDVLIRENCASVQRRYAALFPGQEA